MNYVCGFMIKLDSREVLLIKKNRPEFQKGKWNGIGGKIEADETKHQAMVREFYEETGIVTQENDWEHTITLAGRRDSAHSDPNMAVQPFEVYYFRTFVREFPVYEQKTDEFVSPMLLSFMWNFPCLDNFKWIVPMQMSLNIRFPLHVTWESLN